MVRSIEPCRRPSSTTVGGLFVLLAVLAGLFAMHGLSDHGTLGHDQVEVEQTGSSHHLQSASTSPPVELGGDGGGDTSDDVRSPGHQMSQMGLCLAVLLSVLLLMRARHLRPACVVARTYLRAIGAPLQPRALDPPDLVALSILRC